MLFPGAHEADLRRQCYAVEFARGALFDADTPLVALPVDQLQALVDAPRWSELRVEIETRTKRATVAAYIYVLMFLMDHCADQLPRKGAPGASLSKARHVAEQFAREGAVYGDGSRMLASSKSIKDCWREFKDVAHFWGAIEMNKVAEYAPPNRVLRPENQSRFLSTVSYLQAFGLTHTLKDKAHAGQTLLDPATAWLLDIHQHPPQMLFRTDSAAFNNAPFMRLLRSYRA